MELGGRTCPGKGVGLHCQILCPTLSWMASTDSRKSHCRCQGFTEVRGQISLSPKETLAVAPIDAVVTILVQLFCWVPGSLELGYLCEIL